MINYVDLILKVLSNRKGFDNWWDNIDEEYQEEIKMELQNILYDYYMNDEE